MHVLKRMSTKELRQGYPKGRKVLYVWDCVGIDIRQWFNWKESAAVYFLSCNKENMKITCYGEKPFDREDLMNAGVQSDELVINASSGVTFRLIKYQCPQTDTQYEFINNLMVLLQNSISQRQGISDDKEIARAKKRCDAAMGKCREHGTQISPLYLNPRKRSQFSLKSIRWLRCHLTSNSLFCDAIGSFRRVYALL
jgi:hypothetical protein